MAGKGGFFSSLFGRGKQQQKPCEAGGTRAPEPSAKPLAYQVGERIGGRFEIFQMFGGEGRSGMGVVYVVYDHEHRAVYAMKTFQDRYLASSSARETFRHEALAWTRLERHPYIVRAGFVEELSGRLFITLEYIAADQRGCNSLSHYLTGEPLSTEKALRWAIQFCHGMEHAYAKGIACHRDIKPENILISADGVVKITDFGLARAVQAGEIALESAEVLDEAVTPGLTASRLQGGRVWCGTPGYLAPEIVQGAEGDAKTDLYAFGLVLHQMASGNQGRPSRRLGVGARWLPTCKKSMSGRQESRRPDSTAHCGR